MRRSIADAVFFVALCAAMLSPLDAAAQLDSNSFGPVTLYNPGANLTYSVAVGDLNGDGFVDIVVSNKCFASCGHTGVRVLMNNGNGTFSPAVSYETDGYAAPPWMSVAIADVDGDGAPDVVVLNSARFIQGTPASVSVMRGNGDGTIQAATSYSLSLDPSPNIWVNPTRLTTGDVNGDGTPDILVGNSVVDVNLAFVRGAVTVLLNHGDGSFADAVLYDSGGYEYAPDVRTADVNRDGVRDIVVLNSCSTPAAVPQNGSRCHDATQGPMPATVGVLLGNGNGTFQPAITYPSGAYRPQGLAVVDLDRDGNPDVLVAHFSGSASVLKGAPDGSFQPAVNYVAAGLQPVGIAAGDVDGDGAADAVVLNSGVVSSWPGTGDGTFGAPALKLIGPTADPNTVVLADVNNDGKPDAVVATWNSVGVLLNQTPRSATATTLLSQPNPSGESLAVTLTATVSSAATGVPTGIVTFREGATILGTASLVNAEATLSFSSLSLGSHDLVASYSSDSAFRASDSAPLTQGVIEALRSLTLTAASVIGGVKPKGTVTLNGKAPPGGAVVTLSSGDPSATVPVSVKIQAGATSATFTITTRPVSTTAGPFDISARYRGVTRSAPLTVLAARTSKLTVSPASVVGGVSAQGTVTLTGRAPAGGALVALASANSSATVAGSVTVPAGSTSATFRVTTIPVATTQGPFKITATYNGVARSDTLIVKAPAVLSVVLNPTTVTGGGHSTGTMTLTGLAASGITVTLKSSKIGVATVPVNVIVSTNSKSATFDITTIPVAASSAVMISATAGGTTKKATLTVTP